MKIFIVIFFLFFFTSSIIAKEQSAATGFIHQPCGGLNELLSENATEEEKDWIYLVIESGVTGYLSGLNFFIETVNNGKYKNLYHHTNAYMRNYLIKFCENNPNKYIMEFALDYVPLLPDLEE